jgi:hypothetical protein
MSQMCHEQTNAAFAFLILDGSIEFGDKPCQVCCGPRWASRKRSRMPSGRDAAPVSFRRPSTILE